MKASGMNLKTLIMVGSASAFALLAAPMFSDVVSGGASPLVASAMAADTHDHGDGGSGGHAGKGGKGGAEQGQKGKGSSHEGGAGGPSKSVEAVITEEEEGGKGKMGSGVHGQGKYQDNKMGGGASAPGPGGTNDEPNDAKGPRYAGGAGTGSQGGKPPWAQEGIDESVEMGRLNVARAPGRVLLNLLDEATATLLLANASATTSIYEAASIEAVDVTPTSVRVDSPLENLALLKDLLSDGQLDGDTVPEGQDGDHAATFVPTMSTADFVALLIGSAADKTVPINVTTVNNLLTIMDLDLPAGVSPAEVAADAETVRLDILSAHEGN